VSRAKIVANTGSIGSAGRKSKQKRRWMNLSHSKTQILNLVPNSLTPMKTAILTSGITSWIAHQSVPSCHFRQTNI